MKKWMLLAITIMALTALPHKSHAIVWAVVKAAAVKVIKAIDLQVQRMQNRTIGLQNAQKAIENAMSKLKLNDISSWVEKQRSQYEEYYNELWKVRTAISYYQRIRRLMEKQVQIVDQYRNAYRLFSQDKNFRPSELSDMTTIYEGILGESLQNIDELLLVINSFSTEMSDAQRLEVIARAGDKLDQNLAALKSFNRSNALLSIERAKDQTEVIQLKRLYGLPSGQ